MTVHRSGYFLAERDPAKVLVERRMPVVVDAMGRPRQTALLFTDLSDTDKIRFTAQLAAWQAACDLATAAGNAAQFGGNTPHDLVERWDYQRRAWWAAAGITPPGRTPIRTVTPTGGLL